MEIGSISQRVVVRSLMFGIWHAGGMGLRLELAGLLFRMGLVLSLMAVMIFGRTDVGESTCPSRCLDICSGLELCFYIFR